MSAPQAGGPAIVAAHTEHLPALQALIFDHGANIWNYLPEDGIREHLDDIAQGRAHGVLALQDGHILGAVTFALSTDFDRYLTAPLRGTPQGYVSEAVVRRAPAVRREAPAVAVARGAACLRRRRLEEVGVWGGCFTLRRR